MIDSLDVILWGNKVGTLLSQLGNRGRLICFYFDSDFVKSGIDIAPLRAPLSSVVAQKGLPVYPDKDKIFSGLPSFIADSMPDRWGSIIFDEWAKANNIKKKDLNALDRLAYIGRRGMGALEFQPSMSRAMEEPFKVEIAELSKLAQMAIKESEELHVNLSEGLAIESLFRVGTSAGGRRPKAVINVNIETGECYSGQVNTPVEGFTPMIIKFDEHSDIPSTRIEYSYWLMARSAGLNMMPSFLMERNGEFHFLTERFDRCEGEKIHVQSLAAMLPDSSTYEELFNAAVLLNLMPDEKLMLFKQMVLNVLAANIDDHNKNFSFTMVRNGAWRLSPVYDFTFTVDPYAPYYINRHSMTVNGNNQSISREDMLTLATKYGIKGADSIIDEMVNAVAGYRRHAIEAAVPENCIGKIEKEIAARLAALDNR